MKKTTIITCILSLSACSYDARQTAVHHHIEAVKAGPIHPVEPVPVFKPLEQFTYPENKAQRSPFKAKQNQAILQVLQPDMTRQKQPLESYPLDTLKFVGTLEEGMKRWALIRSPNGQVVRVQVGDYMGQNYGKVIAVSENSLIIEERHLEEGTWVKHMVTFRLEALTLPQDIKKKH